MNRLTRRSALSLGLVALLLVTTHAGRAVPEDESPLLRPPAPRLPALHRAIIAGDVVEARALLGGDDVTAPKVDLFIVDLQGWTALHRAALRPRAGGDVTAQAIALLVDAATRQGLMKGGSIFGPRRASRAELLLEARDRRGRTALHLAASRGPRPVKALLDAGADANATNDAGNTPLHVALASGHDFAAQALLRAGGNPGIRNARGLSAIDVSAESPFRPILMEAARKAKPARDVVAVGARWTTFLKAMRDGTFKGIRESLTPEALAAVKDEPPRWIAYEPGDIAIRGNRASAKARVRYPATTPAGKRPYVLEADLVRRKGAWLISDVHRVLVPQVDAPAGDAKGGSR